jgi:hypothetical protein
MLTPPRPTDKPASETDRGPALADLAAGRAAIAKGIVDAAAKEAVRKPYPTKDTPDGAEAQRARVQALAIASAGALVYVEDKVSKGQAHTRGTAADFRVAKGRCAKCGAGQDLAQQLAHGADVWTPDAVGFFTQVACWRTDGDRWFCGASCEKYYTQQMAEYGGKPLPAVERLNDASYARRMYAQPAPAPAPAPPPPPAAPATDETTPAAPPALDHGKRRR